MFVTETLANCHDRSSFHCGVDELDVYLRQQASQDVRRRAAAVFVMRPVDRPGIIAGYYTLSAASLSLNAIPETLRGRIARYPEVPAILIGRLARDIDYPGIGTKLLVDAFERSLRVAEEIAATLVLVDAKNERATEFYRSFGFESVRDRAERMFIPLKTVATALENR